MSKKNANQEPFRIVHIAPNAPYNDNWGYQDNLLPRYQRKLGYDVSIIVTNRMHKDGTIVEGPERDYRLADGVRVFRRKYRNVVNRRITAILNIMPCAELLQQLKPDFIFYHGLISCTIFQVLHYHKKHPHCILVEDNHLDYNIGMKADTWKEKVLRGWYRLINKMAIPSVSKVYGVTPWRKTYAEEYFKIPAAKTDVLLMGADDEEMKLEHRAQIRGKIREQYGIGAEDFLIVTGGKIDRKKKIDILMEACAEIEHIKLLIFGNVLEDVKERFFNLANKEQIIYIGWIASSDVYDYFYAADLCFFPGQHSVLWEQACAAKVPCVFEKWEGMDHVNHGGNSDFVSPVTKEAICEKIQELYYTKKYARMKQVAESEQTDIYRYSNIAKKSLECLCNESDKN